MRGAYQSPLSWTSKAIVLPVWTFPFRVVCMCVHVPTGTNVHVSCQNWLGWEKEKWVLKKWTNLFKLQYPWGSQCTDARESRPRMLLREHVVSGDMWLHPASLGRKEQQEETFPEPFREMKRSQETEWARLPGTEIGYAQPLQRVFCPSQLQQYYLQSLPVWNIPLCSLCKMFEYQHSTKDGLGWSSSCLQLHRAGMMG